jgi:hypothetical protein
MRRYPVTLLAMAWISSAAAEGLPAAGEVHVYVASNLVQSRAHGIFSTLTLTNTTEYWFNPRIYLVDAEGNVVKEFAPLLKGFATWQKSSVDFLPEDFNGSIWVVSTQPVVATAFMHQIHDDGTLSLLGNAALVDLEPAAGVAAAQALVSAR